MRARVPIAVLLCCLLQPVLQADFFDGMEAYRRGDDAEAARQWLPLARRGDIEAQYRVGALYEDEDGSLHDDAEAARWYGLAAQRGHALAQAHLGRMYESGRGVEVDPEEAVEWFRRAAMQGVVAAQFDLGRMFAEGRGVAEDPARALDWFREAAEDGHAGAQFELGRMIASGRGAAPNDAKAAKWYRRAARRHHAAAQNALGLLYDAGRGVDRNPAKAASWYRRAAEQGLAPARRNLASMYAQGDGVPVDYDEAMRWLVPVAGEPAGDPALLRDEPAGTLTLDRIVAMRRDDEIWEPLPAASGELSTAPAGEAATPSGTVTGSRVEPQPPAAVPLAGAASAAAVTLSGASGATDAEALYREGRRYGLGEEVPADHAEAERSYRAAAELGHGMACYRLGFAHLRGQNAAAHRDDVQAWFWFSLAAEREIGDAGRWRDQVAGKMSAKEFAEGRALLEDWTRTHPAGAPDG